MYLPNACLFDLDGVLLDTEHLHGQAWFLTASNFGTELTREQLILLRGQRRIDCATQILKWIQKSVEMKDFLAVHKPISRNLLSQAKAMPGAEEIVRWCINKSLPIALVTSSTSEAVALKTAPHAWLNLIKLKVFGDDPELLKGKPFPDPFLLAAKKLKVNPKDCWALEDSQAGTKAALSAGCQVWVLDSGREASNKKREYPVSNPMHINHLKIVLNSLQKAYEMKPI